MSDSDTPYTSLKRKSQGSRPPKKKTRSSGPAEEDDEDDVPTQRRLRKRTSRRHEENGDLLPNEHGERPRGKRRKLHNIVYKSHIKSLCEFLLKGLMEHEFGNPFLHPVPTDKYDTYLDKVKEPMDFSTIKRKLEKDTYTEAEDFAMDVRLVFKNCLIFNDHESDLVFMAQQLRKLFEESFTEIKRREKRLLEDVEFEEMKKLIVELKSEHDRMKIDLQRLAATASPKLPAPSTETTTTITSEPPKKERKPKRPWDLQRKHELLTIVSNLSDSQQPNLLQFVTTHIPAAFSLQTGELDLDQSDDILEKLERFALKSQKADANGHVDVDIDGLSSDSSSDESAKKTITTQSTQPSQPSQPSQSSEPVSQVASQPVETSIEETKPLEQSKPVEEIPREEKEKKDENPPELESEPHPISSKTTIVQSTTEEKSEDISATSVNQTEPVDMMQIDNVQVEAVPEQKAVEITEPRAVEMTDATITTSS